ncbi:MAG: aminoacyl-tRNA hydrolase [Sandaracinaceae bacterium]
MHLLAGLGNPGPTYQRNRHNFGFLLVDRLASDLDAPPLREKFKGEVAKTRVDGEDVVLLKPMTFMNLSGESVRAAMAFYKIPLARVLVFHDELDLPFGTVRLKEGGGAGGHNGLRSIIQHCGGPAFLRLRGGIGRPPRGRPESWVLSDFSPQESAELPDVLDHAARAARRVVTDGIRAAMNAFHGPSKP